MNEARFLIIKKSEFQKVRNPKKSEFGKVQIPRSLNSEIPKIRFIGLLILKYRKFDIEENTSWKYIQYRHVLKSETPKNEDYDFFKNIKNGFLP